MLAPLPSSARDIRLPVSDLAAATATADSPVTARDPAPQPITAPIAVAMETSSIARSSSQPSTLSYLSASTCVLIEPDDRRYARLERAPPPRSARSSVSSNKGGKRRRTRLCWHVVGVISLILSLAAIVSSVAVLVHMRSIQEEPVCLPCLSIVTHPILESDARLGRLLRKRENGSEMCCAQNSRQEVLLLEMLLRRKEEENHVEEAAQTGGRDQSSVHPDPPHTEVSAHVLISPQDSQPGRHGQDSRIRDGLFPVRHWQSNLQLSHLRGIDLMRNDTLLVRTKGRYFVYCQIYFRRIVSTPVNAIFTMHVFRFNVRLPGNEEEMLKGVSGADGTDTKHMRTTYIGGVFELEEHDELYVKVSDPTAISTDVKASFFGLFKLPP